MGFYVAWLSIHLQLSSIITMPVAAAFCDSRHGWAGVYYLQGTLTFILFVIFFAYYRDSAALHPNVGSKEIESQRDKFVRVLEKEERMAVPYKEMFTDWAVIGCIVSCFSSNMGYNVFIQYGPTYLNKVLDFDVQHTGFAAVIPSIICIAVKFTAGPCSDHLPYLNARWRVIVFATVSQFCMAGCFTSLAFLPSGHPSVAQALFTGAIVFSGLNAVGVIKSCHLISGRFAYIIMAMHQFTNSLIVLILPALVAFMAPDNTRSQWSRILISISVLVVSAIIFFDFTCEGTSRKWAIETAPPIDASHPIDILALDLGNEHKVEQVLAEKREADEGITDLRI